MEVYNRWDSDRERFFTRPSDVTIDRANRAGWPVSVELPSRFSGLNNIGPQWNLLCHKAARFDKGVVRHCQVRAPVEVFVIRQFTQLRWVAVISAKNHKRQRRKRHNP